MVPCISISTFQLWSFVKSAKWQSFQKRVNDFVIHCNINIKMSIRFDHAIIHAIIDDPANDNKTYINVVSKSSSDAMRQYRIFLRYVNERWQLVLCSVTNTIEATIVISRCYIDEDLYEFNRNIVLVEVL
jgi:hypothetical protein